jgi:hypothetical protein
MNLHYSPSERSVLDVIRVRKCSLPSVAAWTGSSTAISTTGRQRRADDPQYHRRVPRTAQHRTRLPTLAPARPPRLATIRAHRHRHAPAGLARCQHQHPPPSLLMRTSAPDQRSYPIIRDPSSNRGIDGTAPAAGLGSVQVVAQHPGAGWVAQFGQCSCFDLPDAFSGDSVGLADFVEGAWLAVGEPESQPDNAGLPLGERR